MSLSPSPQVESRAPQRGSAPSRVDRSSLTPMMRQYVTVKDSYPNAVVFFRMGDFFETFFDDAKTCAELLDLTLTARSKDKDPTPMAGVPHHAVEGYIARLVALGKTVVLVDQVEDPKLAKGLVRREVTRVLSPGTFLDPNAPPRLPTYLVSIFGDAAKRSGAFGIAVLDLSTGEFRATSTDSQEMLLDELSRLGMREILVSEKVCGTALHQSIQTELPRTTMTIFDDSAFRAKSAGDAIVRVLGADEYAGAKSALTPEAIVASGAILRYLEETQLKVEGASLAHIDALVPYMPSNGLVLDAQACAHLELFHSAHDGGRPRSLIGAIDKAVTSMGGRRIVRWLAYPLADRLSIRERQDAVQRFLEYPAELDDVRQRLKAVADVERIMSRVMLSRATPKDLSRLRDSLLVVPDILKTIKKLSGRGKSEMFAKDGANILGRIGSADACKDVCSMLAGALVDDPANEITGSGSVFRVGFDSEFDRWNDLAQNGKGMIANLENKERLRTKISSLKVRYNRVFGYFIEVTKVHLKSVPEDYIRKQTTANGERYYTPELKTLEAEVLSAEQRRDARSNELFATLVQELLKTSRRILDLAEQVSEIDVLAGFARLAEERGWVCPEIGEHGAIEIREGRHPVLELLDEELGERFVPNDILIDDNERLLIITGPNMAGKSTIMRQTALITILAHMGCFVPAASARVGLVDRIFTRVGASDDLSRGRSTFMVEMTETARILRSATKRSLILLDEIGRGTSTFDGLSIAWSVAEHLHDKIQAKTLFATHYHELTEITRDRPHAKNRHVAVKEWKDSIVFLRKIADGPTNRSYGVQVARIAGLPKPVVDRARTILSALELDSETGHGPRVDVRRATSQMSLFGGAHQPIDTEHRTASPTQPDGGCEHLHNEVLAALRDVSVESLTPLDALNLLAEWKTRLTEEGNE